MLNLLIPLMAVYLVGVGLAFLIGAIRIHIALSDHRNYRLLYSKERTAHRIKPAREIQRRCFLWPTLPVLAVRSLLQKADALVAEVTYEQTKRDYEAALCEYERTKRQTELRRGRDA